MRKFMFAALFIGALGFVACGSDDNGGGDDGGDGCVTCDAYDQGGVTFPEVEVCEGENGNAFLEGVDTTVAYSTYISALESFTDCN